jgi:hypothetical protein
LRSFQHRTHEPPFSSPLPTWPKKDVCVIKDLLVIKVREISNRKEETDGSADLP